MTQATLSPARAIFIASAAFVALAASQLEGQCTAGACHQPVEALEEDDVSLLSLATQVHTRSHRKEPSSQEQQPAQPPVGEARPRPQPRKHIAVAPFVAQDAGPSPATEEFEAEEAEEEAALRGQYAETPRAEEDPQPVQSDGPEAGPPAAQEEAPRRRPHHHEPEPRAAEPAPEPAAESEDPAADELAPDEVDEEPGAAWSGAEVYAPTHHRKRPVAAPATWVPSAANAQAPEARVQTQAAEAAAEGVALSSPKPLSPPSQLPGNSLKALWAGNVEAPIPLLVIGVVFLAGLGAFLLHEISERTERQKQVGEAQKAHVTTPPLEPGAMDSSFLFHVLNCVESEKDQRAPTAEVLNKGPPNKQMDDSSDDCSTCPRPQQEPESECDDCEEVFGKLREADWALQIAYSEALQRRNENSGGGKRSSGSNPAKHSRSSAKRQDALAALYQARAEALRARGSEQP